MNMAAIKVAMIFIAALVFPIILGSFLGQMLGAEFTGMVVGLALGLALCLVLVFMTSFSYVMFGMKLFFNKSNDIYVRVLKNRGLSFDVGKREDEARVVPSQEDSKVPLKDVPPHIDMASRRPVHILVQDVREEVDLLKKYVPDMALRRINQAIAHAFETGLRIGQRMRENRMLMLVCILVGLNLVIGGIGLYYAQQAQLTAQGAASSAQVAVQLLRDMNAAATVQYI